MERTVSTQLPMAHFSRVATGAEERKQHYLQKHQLPSLNSVPFNSEEELAQVDSWMELDPLLPQGAAPPVERAVERLNQEFEQYPPQSVDELADLVQDLRDNTPVPLVLLPASQSPAASVSSETILETTIPPLDS